MNMRFTRAATLSFLAAVTAAAIPVATADTVEAATQAVPDSRLPSGMIVMWAGSLAEIPTGWLLCDGRNGTPDLRDRFVMGVGAVEYMGSTGGSFHHRHKVESHRHVVDPPRTRADAGRSSYSYSGPRYRSLISIPSGDIDISAFKSEAATPGTRDAPSLPPFYKIAFIMKD